MHNNNEKFEVTMVCCVKEMNDEKETSEHFKRILSKQNNNKKPKFCLYICCIRMC